jgi:hypothetical protein
MTIDSSTYKKKKKRKKPKAIGEPVVIKGNEAPKKRHRKKHVNNQLTEEVIAKIEQSTNPFRFSMVGANHDGSRIFCLLKMRTIGKSGRIVWKRIIDGYYDFDRENFFITAERKLYKNPIYPGARIYTREEIIAVLRENLGDFDWEYKETAEEKK